MKVKVFTGEAWQRAVREEEELHSRLFYEGWNGWGWVSITQELEEASRLPQGRLYIVNAISLNMASEAEGAFRWKAISPAEAKEVLADGFISAIGHEDMARILSAVLGLEVPANRATIEVQPGDRLVVAQYKGPRLPEGATRLPEGARVEFFLVEVF